ATTGEGVAGHAIAHAVAVVGEQRNRGRRATERVVQHDRAVGAGPVSAGPEAPARPIDERIADDDGGAVVDLHAGIEVPNRAVPHAIDTRGTEQAALRVHTI